MDRVVKSMWKWTFLLLTSCVGGMSTQQCGLKFEFFPDINGTLHVVENETVNIIFILKGDMCQATSSLYISVFKHNTVACRMREINGQCSLSSGVTLCKCTAIDRLYYFAKEITRFDNAAWSWTATEGTKPITRSDITFNVSYPLRLISLMVNGDSRPGPFFISRQQPVQIDCHWENGYPPDSVHLLDQHGKLLVREYGNRTTTYTSIFSICDEIRHFYCEAVRSLAKMSTTIIVTCPSHAKERGIDKTNAHTSIASVRRDNTSVADERWKHLTLKNTGKGSDEQKYGDMVILAISGWASFIFSVFVAVIMCFKMGRMLGCRHRNKTLRKTTINSENTEFHQAGIKNIYEEIKDFQQETNEEFKTIPKRTNPSEKRLGKLYNSRSKSDFSEYLHPISDNKISIGAKRPSVLVSAEPFTVV